MLDCSLQMGEKVIVMDRGNVEFLCPDGWTVTRSPQGHLTLTDPSESCRLEISYARSPPEARNIPINVLLRRLLEHVPEAGADTKIDTVEEAERRLAWADYVYPSADKRTGDAAEAHGRWLIASNNLFQLLMTFYYWDNDTKWAVPAWDRFVETTALGDGTQLESPEEHWSMRLKN